MKLYDSVGPNPHVVRMFIAEKGISIPSETVDLRAGDNRKEPHLSRNPHGQLPTLGLDNGTYLSEIIPICEYIEEKHPAPSLIGTTPEERGECRMWTRRIDLNIAEPGAAGFRFAEGLKMFETRIVTVPEAAPGMKKIAANRLAWLEGQMNGKEFICGNRFTLADILLFCMVTFFNRVGQPLDPANKNLAAWFERVQARPSAKA
jgi:glutathione S-transferase